MFRYSFRADNWEPGWKPGWATRWDSIESMRAVNGLSRLNLIGLFNSSGVDSIGDSARPNQLRRSGLFVADETLTSASIVGTETVVSSEGTCTPVITAGTITFDAGTCWDIELSNGSIYTHPTKAGIAAIWFDSSGNGRHLKANVASTTVHCVESLEYGDNTLEINGWGGGIAFNGTTEYIGGLSIPFSELQGDITAFATFLFNTNSGAPFASSSGASARTGIRLFNGQLRFYRHANGADSYLYPVGYTYIAGELCDVIVSFYKATGECVFLINGTEYSAALLMANYGSEVIDTGDFAIARQGDYDGNYADGIVFRAGIQGHVFELDEGTGTTITDGNGVSGTLNTSDQETAWGSVKVPLISELLDSLNGAPFYTGRAKFSTIISGDSFAFPATSDLYLIDQLAGGDFFYNSAASFAPIYRTQSEWIALDFVNDIWGGYVGVGNKGLYVYSSEQSESDYLRAQKVIGNTYIFTMPELYGVMIGDSLTASGGIISSALKDTNIHSLVNAGIQGDTLAAITARAAAGINLFAGENLLPGGEFDDGVDGFHLLSADGAITHNSTLNKLELTNTVTHGASMYSPGAPVEPNTTYQLLISRNSYSTIGSLFIWVGTSGTVYNTSVMSVQTIGAWSTPIMYEFTTGPEVEEVFIGIQNGVSTLGGVTILDSIGIRADSSLKNFVAIQGGINDIASTEETLNDLIGYTTGLIDSVYAAGYIPVVFNSNTWADITQAKKDLVDAYNIALEPLCRIKRTPYVNMYEVLLDPLNPQTLNPIYDSGDGLHPNIAGYNVVGDKFRNVMKTKTAMSLFQTFPYILPFILG